MKSAQHHRYIMKSAQQYRYMNWLLTSEEEYKESVDLLAIVREFILPKMSKVFSSDEKLAQRTLKRWVEEVWGRSIKNSCLFLLYDLHPAILFGLCLIRHEVRTTVVREEDDIEFLCFIRNFRDAIKDYFLVIMMVRDRYRHYDDPRRIEDLENVSHIVVRSLPFSYNRGLGWKSKLHGDYVKDYVNFHSKQTQVGELCNSIFEFDQKSKKVRNNLKHLRATPCTLEVELELEDLGSSIESGINNLLHALSFQDLFPNSGNKSVTTNRPKHKLAMMPCYVIEKGRKMPEFVLKQSAMWNEPFDGVHSLRNARQGRYLKCIYCCKTIFLCPSNERNWDLRLKIDQGLWQNSLKEDGIIPFGLNFLSVDQKSNKTLRATPQWKDMRQHIMSVHSKHTGLTEDGKMEFGFGELYKAEGVHSPRFYGYESPTFLSAAQANGELNLPSFLEVGSFSETSSGC